MDLRTTTTLALAGMLLVLPTACSTTPESVSGPPAPSPVSEPSERPTFEACDREAAEAGTTNLRPSELTQADREAAEAVWGGTIPEGRLVLEHATDLTLPLGELGFGNGYDAAVGGLGGDQLRRVAAPGTSAPITLAVLEGSNSARSVAFVEVRVGDGVPVRWEEDPALGFVTDGGDGGVWAPATPDEQAVDDVAAFDSIEAMYPNGDSASGNVCVLRSTKAGVDGVQFSAGWGDGGYPTFVGYDAAGQEVSVVSHGLIIPWSLSGLPGTPPSGEDL